MLPSFPAGADDFSREHASRARVERRNSVPSTGACGRAGSRAAACGCARDAERDGGKSQPAQFRGSFLKTPGAPLNKKFFECFPAFPLVRMIFRESMLHAKNHPH